LWTGTLYVLIYGHERKQSSLTLLVVVSLPLAVIENGRIAGNGMGRARRDPRATCGGQDDAELHARAASLGLAIAVEFGHDVREQ
jgi:hypothetical protein